MGVIHFPLTCRWCRHDLQGQAIDARCPQCAREIRDTLDPHLFDPVTLTVNVDALCVKCGYNLRTLTIDQVCPECAHPVADSLRPNELRFADYGWMENVRMGTIFLLIWLYGFWSYVLLLTTLFVTKDFLLIGLPLLFWLHGLTWSMGVFLFTTPEPSPSIKFISTRSNWIARLSAIGYQLLLPITISLDRSPFIFLSDPKSIGFIVVIGLYCVGSAALTMCMKRLAERANRPELTKLAVKQLGISMIVWVLVFLSFLASWACILLAAMWFLIVVSYIEAIGLLLKLHHMVNEGMKTSRQESK